MGDGRLKRLGQFHQFFPHLAQGGDYLLAHGIRLQFRCRVGLASFASDLFACAFDGVTLFAGESLDMPQQFQITLHIATVAPAVFDGSQAGELFLPKTQGGTVLVQQSGNFADSIVQLAQVN